MRKLCGILLIAALALPGFVLVTGCRDSTESETSKTTTDDGKKVTIEVEGDKAEKGLDKAAHETDKALDKADKAVDKALNEADKAVDKADKKVEVEVKE